MAKKIKRPPEASAAADDPLSPEEEAALASPLSAAEAVGDPRSGLADLGVVPGAVPRAIPEMDDPGWADYVMAQFTPEEMDADGHPRVRGMRRVVRRVLGPILGSHSEVVQPPRAIPGGGREACVVRCRVEVLFAREETPYRAAFDGLADADAANTDPNFARFPTAMAETRAEGRALSKALGLMRVTAEEKALVAAPPEAEFVEESQLNFFDLLCRNCDVNVPAAIRSVIGRPYSDVRRMPYATAQRVCEKLSEYHNDPSKVPEELRGYEEDWKS